MKKAFLFLAALFALSFGAYAETDPYTLDDNAIDEVFAQATEVSLNDVNAVLGMDFNLTPNGQNGPQFNASSVNPWVAWVLCWVVGGFGIHRHYLGTSKWMWALYTFTCGGIFGIVTTVDWVVLLIGAITNDYRQYTNNDSFFMWL